MSIINQRRKIKLLIWISGFLSAAIVYSAMVYFFSLDPGVWLNRYRPEKKDVFVEIPVAARHLEKGSVLSEQDIEYRQVEKGFMEPEEGTSYTDRTLRVGLPEGMPLTDSFFTDGAVPGQDLRIVESEAILIPESLEINDFVDVRIVFPTGENRVVLSKKKVGLFNRDETGSGKVWLELGEKEIELLSKAVARTLEEPAAYLYMATYIEPTLQQASKLTFEEAGW